MASFASVEVVVGVLVILIETVILFKLYRHSRLMTDHFRKLDQHTIQLEKYVQHLDRQTDRMEETMDSVLVDVEDIYKRVCKPAEEKAGKVSDD